MSDQVQLPPLEQVLHKHSEPTMVSAHRGLVLSIIEYARNDIAFGNRSEGGYILVVVNDQRGFNESRFRSEGDAEPAEPAGLGVTLGRYNSVPGVATIASSELSDEVRQQWQQELEILKAQNSKKEIRG